MNTIYLTTFYLVKKCVKIDNYFLLKLILIHKIGSLNFKFDYVKFTMISFQGPAVVVVSCVEEKGPYRAHPHNLVGRGSICRKGVCR
jgi:hypothetical protein